MSAGQPKVLVLDGMWNKSLAAVRSLGRRGFYVTAGERTRLAAALFSRYCSRRWVYPSPFERSGAFLDLLEQELSKGKYDVLIPMEWSTQALLTQAGNRERIERLVRIPFADAGTACTVNDKAWLMHYARSRGIEVPKTCFIENEDDLGRIAGMIDYPVLVKPRESSGSRGILRAAGKDELLRAYAIVHARFPFPIIQECLPPGGDAYGVGLLLNFRSEVRASFVYRRLREYPVSGGPSTLRESVERGDVRETAESLMTSLKWQGVAHAEFRIDPRDGRPKLLEINPRFWGSLSLAVEAGVDFPYLLCRMAMEGDVAPVRDYAVGVRSRWLIPGDLLHFIGNPERFRLEPGFFDFSMKDDIISRHDPLPVLGRVLSIAPLLFDKEMRRLLRR